MNRKGSSISQAQSTPKKGTSRMPSPQLSLISTINTRTSSHVEFEDEETFDTSGNYDVYFNEATRKVPHTGKIWIDFKPIRESGLYCDVIDQPELAEKHAKNLLKRYESDPKNVVCDIIQFFIDVCGFQTVDINELYNYTELDMSKLVSTMERTKKVMSSHAIFESNQKLAFDLRMGIFNFVQKLLQVAYANNIVFRTNFAKHTLNCVHRLADSDMYVLKMTGTILCAKFLTEFCWMYSILEEDRKLEYQDRILQYINHMYTIFTKNWFIGDKRWKYVKCEISSEMKYWMKYCPFLFTNRFDIIPYINKCLKDENDIVRKEILNTCEYLFKCEKLSKEKPQLVKELHLEVCNRNLDINETVAVKALTIWRYLQNNNFPGFKYNENMKKIIFVNLYGPRFLVAKASADIIHDIIIKCTRDPKYIIVNLSKQLLNPDNSHLGVFLVESFFHYDEIKHWETYVSLMKDPKIADEHQINVFKMAYFSVYQTLKGCPWYSRFNSVTGPEAGPEVHVQIGRQFIPNILHLLNKYEAYPSIIINILDIVLLIDTTEFAEEYQLILKSIEKLFKLYDNVEVLEKINEVLYFLKLDKKVDGVDECLEEFSDLYIEQSSKNSNDFDLDNLKKISMKISVLFSKFDLAKITWDNLYQIWKTNEEYTEYLVIACKHHLIWQLKNLTKKMIPAQLTSLKNKKQAFVRMAFIILNRSDRPIAVKMFLALSDLYTELYKVVEKNETYQKQLETLVLKLNDERYFKYLGAFIENKNIDRKVKQKCVVGAIGLMFLDIANPFNIVYIFKYYHSHFDEIGYLIEDALLTVYKIDNSNSLLLWTIFNSYRNICDNHEAFTVDIQEFKELKSLSKQFVRLKTLKFNEEFVRNGVNMALKDKEHLLFFHILSYFLDDLTAEEKYTIKKDLKVEARKKNFHAEDSVIYFFSCLNKKKEGTPVRKPEPVQRRAPKMQPRQLKLQIEKSVAPTKPKKDNKDQKMVPTSSSESALSLLTIHDESDDDRITEFDSDNLPEVD